MPKTAEHIAPNTTSIRRRIAHMLERFEVAPLQGVAPGTGRERSEAHLIDLDSLQLVELSLHIEAEFDIDFRDDLIPPSPTLGDFVDMVQAALRQKAVVPPCERG